MYKTMIVCMKLNTQCKLEAAGAKSRFRKVQPPKCRKVLGPCLIGMVLSTGDAHFPVGELLTLRAEGIS